MSKLYLMGAGQTFDMKRFQYVRELVDGLDCVLQMSSGPFSLEVGEQVPFSFCIIFGQNKNRNQYRSKNDTKYIFKKFRVGGFEFLCIVNE